MCEHEHQYARIHFKFVRQTFFQCLPHFVLIQNLVGFPSKIATLQVK